MYQIGSKNNIDCIKKIQTQIPNYELSDKYIKYDYFWCEIEIIISALFF